MINQIVDLFGIARGPNKLTPILKTRIQPWKTHRPRPHEHIRFGEAIRNFQVDRNLFGLEIWTRAGRVRNIECANG